MAGSFEVQGTAEKTPFTEEKFLNLLRSPAKGSASWSTCRSWR
jgi:ribonuclease PH